MTRYIKCLLIILICVFCSCTKDILRYSEEKITFSKPISLHYNKFLTKASQAFEDDKSFVVVGKMYNNTQTYAAVGWNASEMYINKEICSKVSSSPSSWGMTSAYYWPDNKKLVFSAYSPVDIHEDIVTVSDIGVSFRRYELPNNVAEHVDLLYSEREAEQSQNVHVPDGITYPAMYGVQLMFKHALSKISFAFSIDAEYPNTKVRVTSITFRGLNTRGDFDQNLTNTEIGNGSPAWSFQDLREPLHNIVKNSDVIITTTPNSDNFRDTFIIPQVIRSNNSAVVEIIYTVQTGDGTPVQDSKTFVLNKLKLNDGTTNKIQEFRINHHYNFEIEFTGSILGIESMSDDVIKISTSNHENHL